jgi:hypothetical protein
VSGDKIERAKSRDFRSILAAFFEAQAERMNGWLTWKGSNFDTPEYKSHLLVRAA